MSIRPANGVTMVVGSVMLSASFRINPLAQIPASSPCVWRTRIDQMLLKRVCPKKRNPDTSWIARSQIEGNSFGTRTPNKGSAIMLIRSRYRLTFMVIFAKAKDGVREDNSI